MVLLHIYKIHQNCFLLWFAKFQNTKISKCRYIFVNNKTPPFWQHCLKMFLRLLHQVRMHTIYFHCPETQMTISGLLALTDFYFQHKSINYIKFKNLRINNIHTCMINLAFLQLSLNKNFLPDHSYKLWTSFGSHYLYYIIRIVKDFIFLHWSLWPICIFCLKWRFNFLIHDLFVYSKINIRMLYTALTS